MEEQKKDFEKRKITWGIIIPFRNSTATALNILMKLYVQRRDENLLDKVEVLVMDDCSKPETRKYMESIQDGLAFKFITPFPLKRKGAGAMRNIGVKIIVDDYEAQYVSFFDADDDIEPDMIKAVYEVLKEGDADYVQWGFKVKNKDASRNRNWNPSSFFKKCPDQFFRAPPAPWIHAIRPWLFKPFPEYLLTDDVIWWFEQADIISSCAHAKKFIEKTLYTYDRTSGGCTRASDYFIEHPTTLEVAAKEDVCENNGYPDRYVSDCFRNIAELYDLRNKIENPEIKKMLITRLSNDFSLAVQGKFGW